MRRPFTARASLPLRVAMLAFAATLAAGAQASGAPANPQPAAQVAEMAQVEGISATNRAVAEANRTTAANASRGSESSFGLRSLDRRRAASPSTSRLGAAPTTTAATVTKKAASPTRSATATAVWWSKYHGTNHVWMPTLGLSKPVYSYACDRSTYPANVVYRWGCAGTNNVYLFGHNFGVFNPLYLAWRNGQLRKGLPVVYADGHGRTRLYRVVTWRVVLATDAAWAIASQPVPSMTLQTCTSTSGPYRLVVRLVSTAR